MAALTGALPSSTQTDKVHVDLKAGAPNDGFLLNTNTFYYPEYLQISRNACGAIKFVSARSSKGNLSLFEIARASVFYPEKFRCNLPFYESENFSHSSLHYIFKCENIRFPFGKILEYLKNIRIFKILVTVLRK